MSQMLRGFQKYISLRVLRNIRLKLISRLGKVNLLKVLGNLLTESHLLRGFRKYMTLGILTLLDLTGASYEAARVSQ